MADTSVSYQCPNCNAPLAYEPGEEKVTCAYCGTEFAVSDLEAFYAAKMKIRLPRSAVIAEIRQ